MASERPHLRPTSVAYLLTTMVALLFKGAVSETTTLQEDYKEFCTIVPFDEIIETIHHYNKTDAKVREFLKRLHDPDITEYANWLYQQKPLHKALEYLEQHGVPGYEVMTRVIALFGWPPFQRPDEHHREARSVHKMAQDVRNLVPPLALFKFYSRKMKTSKEFQDFVEILRSDEFNDMILAAMQHKGYKKLSLILKEAGLDVDSIRKSLVIMFGWGPRQKKKHSAGLITQLSSPFFN